MKSPVETCDEFLASHISQARPSTAHITRHLYWFWSWLTPFFFALLVFSMRALLLERYNNVLIIVKQQIYITTEETRD